MMKMNLRLPTFAICLLSFSATAKGSPKPASTQGSEADNSGHAPAVETPSQVEERGSSFPPPPQDKRARYVANQVILKIKDEVKSADIEKTLQALLDKHFLKVVQNLGPKTKEGHSHLFLLEILEKPGVQSTVEKMISELKKEPSVAYAEPNMKMYLFQNSTGSVGSPEAAPKK